MTIAMIPSYYTIEFYDNREELLISERVKEGTRIDLVDYIPEKDKDTFYGWVSSPNSDQRSIYYVAEDNMKFYGLWGSIIEESHTESIDFEIIEKEDQSLYKGEKVVSQKGSEGLRTIVTEKFVVKGRELDSSVVSRSIEKEPTDEIVLIGTKKREVVKKDVPKRSNNTTPQGIISQPNPTPPKQEEKVYGYGIKVIPNKYNDKFSNCDQLKSVYPLGVPKGHPAYEKYPGGDRDKDGWACEGPDTPGPYYEKNNR